jgi:hypothetical protein
MKKLLIIALVYVFVMGCNNETASTEKTASAADSTEKVDYAYLPSNHDPINWEPGSQKNLALALNTLKAFENGNIEEALKGFADSIWWSVDKFDAKISKDSLRAWFSKSWQNMSGVKIKMNDYESVISKDKKEEWVTLWYKEYDTDKAGKTDSTAYVDDLKIENGKIAILDEKGRKYPVPGK